LILIFSHATPDIDCGQNRTRYFAGGK
jgi:hypothetical protein